MGLSRAAGREGAFFGGVPGTSREGVYRSTFTPSPCASLPVSVTGTLFLSSVSRAALILLSVFGLENEERSLALEPSRSRERRGEI